ncbi:MAG: carboxymuconolactone decarboxylase family protein [Myxococcota bacterium]
MRLEPIEKPRGVLLKLAYAMSRRMLGAVMSPMKVLYARVPYITRISYSLSRVVDKKVSLDRELALLVQAQTSAQNGCGFCLDMKHALAVQHRIGLEKFQALAGYATSPLFDERERAALDFASEVTRDRKVSDATFARARSHFSEAELVELAFVNAVENFYNLMAKPFGIGSDGLCAIAVQKAG